MKTSTAVIALIIACVSAAFAVDGPKVTISAQDMPIKDFIAQVSQQAGASIVLDPKIRAAVTINLTNADLGQALNTVSKLNNLSWKKLQFARPSEETVKLDQIKSAMIALASMPMIGLAIEDPASKTTSAFARNMPASLDTANMKLPDGYAWTSIYVVLAPGSDKPDPTAARAGSGATGSPETALDPKLTEAAKQNVIDLATMNPATRRQVFASQYAVQSNLTPEVRRSMIIDQRQALKSLDAKTRRQARRDLRSILWLPKRK